MYPHQLLLQTSPSQKLSELASLAYIDGYWRIIKEICRLIRIRRYPLQLELRLVGDPPTGQKRVVSLDRVILANTNILEKFLKRAWFWETNVAFCPQ